MNDLFAAQRLIINQLTAQVPGVRQVQGIRELAALHERPGTTPAAYVMYDGQELRMGAGQAQVVDQKWLVVLVTRHVRDNTHHNNERQEAGPLLVHVCRTLLGWQPGPDYGALSLIPAPNPSFRDGFGFYSLRFSTRITLQPAP
ncbi:MAG: hypothetical protein HQL90_11975 [Magnetococcales bacterium]|nr:hypothetical protein [Magnetococcales bacterium]